MRKSHLCRTLGGRLFGQQPNSSPIAGFQTPTCVLNPAFWLLQMVLKDASDAVRRATTTLPAEMMNYNILWQYHVLLVLSTSNFEYRRSEASNDDVLREKHETTFPVLALSL